MQRIEIKPLEGIVIENIGNVYLGQQKSELYNLLGGPSKNEGGNRLFYDDLEVRIDLNQLQKIEFIEFIYGPEPEKTELSIYGVNPFVIDAKELLNILSFNNQGEIDTSEAPYSYRFLNTSIGVWREFSPEDVEPMISTTRLLNVGESDDDNVVGDLKKAQHFWTIGVGLEGYYRM